MRHDLVKMMHTVEIAKLIVKESEYKIDPEDALDMFRNSHIYQCLSDDESGLYGESALYISGSTPVLVDGAKKV